MPQKLLCQVTEIVDHGGQVYTLTLTPERPAPRFQPGQFLHLALDEYNPGDFWPESRVFSIASSPAERESLRITYAVKGKFTGRMEAELRPGSEVWVKLPYGEFFVDATRPVCLLAGGTGVTAFIAFLSALAAEHPHPVTLFYGARCTNLLIYRTRVEDAARRCPNLRTVFMVEEGESQGCVTGRIDADQVWMSQPDPLAVTYYLSGPPVMLKALSAELSRRGVPDGQVCMDAWE